MAVRPVVITGEPVLHRVAARVERFDAELADLVQDMYDTMDAAHGVGLAAPQIGVGLRVFVYEMANDDDVPARGVVVNPILALSKVPDGRPDPDTETEGCLSVPGEHFPLRRAETAKVSGQDLDGQPIEFTATGWFARCMQHEFDHLNGKLYVDRLDDRWHKRARKAIKAQGWGKPGHTWLPGVDPDPFGHDDPDDDTPDEM
ncbi:MAG TPA: peptide deformylase [Dermatophilaceae bacterium]|nr:peptide deformylase [Dermatophilaceae bacterium]